MMRAGRLSAGALAAVLGAATLATPSFDPQHYLAHIKFLSAPEMKGRATGSPELEKAALYIEKEFRSAGLKPLEGTYRQSFPVTTSARMGSGNRFEYVARGHKKKLALQRDFVPLSFSLAGKASGGVVFAGYGITAPEYHYDDYAGIDVHGKFVLILRHEPQEFDEKSVFAGKVYTEYSQFFSKAINARNHGAAGVIVINDRANHSGESDSLESFGSTAGPANCGIPFVQLKTADTELWFAMANRKLEQLESGIDRDLKPQSFSFPDSLDVHESVDVERVVKTVHNVSGYLPGETDEYVIVGAHFDHLGLGEQFSMAPSQAGTVHPGADDNASGTAGVLELARWLAAQPRLRRGVLFLTFAGEELGLLGSSYYVNHPELPLRNAVAMINLDMIGRVSDGKLYVGGAGTGSTLRAILDELAPASHLKMDFSDTSGYGSSDHTSFTTREVPVLFFFSGLHGDYHKPSDTWDKIDAPDAARVLQLVGAAVTKLASEDGRPQFVRVKEPENRHATGTASGSGYGPYFGSIPDFAEPPKGVRFADVKDGSPAAEAGLRRGDILVDFAGKPIQNLYDFTYALRAQKPGDVVLVKVLRGPETITAKVVLRERK